MQAIAIIGAGGHAREQLDLIDALNDVTPRYTVAGLLVDRDFQDGSIAEAGVPILGGLEWLEGRDVAVVCAVGSPAARLQIVARASALGARFATLVHPRASVGRRVELGEGVIVGANAVLTCDVRVAHHVHVNVGATISHDADLGRFATLAPGAHVAGVVRVGEGAEIGVGATVSDRVGIGEWAVLGAGAVAVHDVAANTTVVGVPAREIARRAPGWQLGSHAT
jgi:sugar O-acyltransferase (sialic acid O-acetyltransferase NeuD family)